MGLRLITAGESHGPGLTCIVEGLPAGLALDQEDLNRDMARRQLGHGRGGRMKIEKDAASVTAGVRHGRTLGGPIALQVANRDYANWEERMNPWPVEADVPRSTAPARARGPGRDHEVRAHRRAQRARARERPRDGGARRRRRPGPRVPARPGRRGPLPRRADRLGACAAARGPERRRLRGRGRVAGALPGSRRLGGDGRGDQPPAQGERVAGRRLRGAGLRAGARAGLARLLGGAPRRAARPGDPLHPGDEGRSVGEAFEIAGLPGSQAHDEIFWTRSAATTARPTARAASRAA